MKSDEMIAEELATIEHPGTPKNCEGCEGFVRGVLKGLSHERARSQKLVEALKFYAIENNYVEATMTVKKVDREKGIVTLGNSIHYGAPALVEKGERARSTLEEYENG